MKGNFMGLESGICIPVVAGGGLCIGQQTYSPKTIKDKPTQIHVEPPTQAPTKPQYSKTKFSQIRGDVNNMICPLFKSRASQDKVMTYIANLKDDLETQAWATAYFIIRSSDGFGTYEPGFKGGVYSINENTYELVNQHIKKLCDMSIDELIDSEMSEDEAKDLHRHINQFK